MGRCCNLCPLKLLSLSHLASSHLWCSSWLAPYLCLCAEHPATPCVTAFLPGGEEKAVPGGPRHAHSEDLPWLEVPLPFPTAEEEPSGGSCLVPALCGKQGGVRMSRVSYSLLASSVFQNG